MTSDQAREVMLECHAQGRIAHRARDYARRDRLFHLHDSIAVALIHGYEISPYTPGAHSGCRFRKVFAR